MRTVRYAGRNFSGEAAADVGDTQFFDDEASAQAITTEVEQAEVVFIDDPLSFPWEFVTSPLTAPLIIDVGSCSSDQLVALIPALTHITEFDTIVDRADTDQHSDQFAHLLGARSVEPAPSELPELRNLKHLHCVEARILRRLSQDWQTLVVDFADLVAAPWASTKWSDPSDTRPAAVVVRVGIEVIGQRGGLTAMAPELVDTVAGTSIRDVWGVRSHPGDPLERGLVVIGVDR